MGFALRAHEFPDCSKFTIAAYPASGVGNQSAVFKSDQHAAAWVLSIVVDYSDERQIVRESEAEIMTCRKAILICCGGCGVTKKTKPMNAAPDIKYACTGCNALMAYPERDTHVCR